jgi:hypothetical protein
VAVPVTSVGGPVRPPFPSDLLSSTEIIQQRGVREEIDNPKIMTTHHA